MARLVIDVCSNVIISEVDWTREEGDFATEILERMIEDSPLDLIRGIEVTSSLRDIVIFDLSTKKKGD